MGRGPPGLRPQDTDRAQRGVLHQPQAARHHAVPLAKGEPLRHLRLRPRQQLHIGSAGHGRGREAAGENRRRARGHGRQWQGCRTQGGGRDRRRGHERRAGLRRAQQRIGDPQRHPDNTQRQQHEHRQERGGDEAIPDRAEHKRDIQRPEVQAVEMAALQRLPGRRPPQGADKAGQRAQVGLQPPAKHIRGARHKVLRPLRRAQRDGAGAHTATAQRHERAQAAAPAHHQGQRLQTGRKGGHGVARANACATTRKVCRPNTRTCSETRCSSWPRPTRT